MPVRIRLKSLSARCHSRDSAGSDWGLTIFLSSRFDEDCQETANTLAWIPFGAGPRMCLGMRFAILEIKIVLTRIMKKFTIERCAETKVPCPTKKNGVFSPSEGVYVKLKRRNWTEEICKTDQFEIRHSFLMFVFTLRCICVSCQLLTALFKMPLIIRSIALTYQIESNKVT